MPVANILSVAVRNRNKIKKISAFLSNNPMLLDAVFVAQYWGSNSDDCRLYGNEQCEWVAIPEDRLAYSKTLMKQKMEGERVGGALGAGMAQIQNMFSAGNDLYKVFESVGSNLYNNEKDRAAVAAAAKLCINEYGNLTAEEIQQLIAVTNYFGEKGHFTKEPEQAKLCYGKKITWVYIPTKYKNEFVSDILKVSEPIKPIPWYKKVINFVASVPKKVRRTWYSMRKKEYNEKDKIVRTCLNAIKRGNTNALAAKLGECDKISLDALKNMLDNCKDKNNIALTHIMQRTLIKRSITTGNSAALKTYLNDYVSSAEYPLSEKIKTEIKEAFMQFHFSYQEKIKARHEEAKGEHESEFLLYQDILSQLLNTSTIDMDDDLYKLSVENSLKGAEQSQNILPLESLPPVLEPVTHPRGWVIGGVGADNDKPKLEQIQKAVQVYSNQLHSMLQTTEKLPTDVKSLQRIKQVMENLQQNQLAVCVTVIDKFSGDIDNEDRFNANVKCWTVNVTDLSLKYEKRIKLMSFLE